MEALHRRPLGEELPPVARDGMRVEVLLRKGGAAAARDCGIKILQSVHDEYGTLDNLRVIKVLGCVYSASEFTDQHLVINGCSDLFHEIFGKEGDGYHARSALGFAALPTGAAVEVEAIFEIVE